LVEPALFIPYKGAPGSISVVTGSPVVGKE
jgi:hypothetical protein